MVAACSAGGNGAAGAGAAAPKYPRRKPGCSLLVYASPRPGVPLYDDLGVAEVGCHLDISRPQCMAQLRAQACRMGGDIMYDLPVKPMRPMEQAIVYRARVAHSRSPEAKPEPPPKPGEEPPPPATPEESAGPVVPLGTPSPPAPVPGPDSGTAPQPVFPTFD